MADEDGQGGPWGHQQRTVPAICVDTVPGVYNATSDVRGIQQVDAKGVRIGAIDNPWSCVQPWIPHPSRPISTRGLVRLHPTRPLVSLM